MQFLVSFPRDPPIAMCLFVPTAHVLCLTTSLSVAANSQVVVIDESSIVYFCERSAH